MVSFYPHFLFIYKQDDPVQLPNGEWSTPIGQYVFICECREQVNSNGRYVNSTDGVNILFNSLIHLPLGMNVKPNEKVLVSDSMCINDVRIESNCLRFTDGLMHSRLWL